VIEMTPSPLRPAPNPQRPRADRAAFAARLRAGRAVLGWSQSELGKNAGLTQRAVYRIEKAVVTARNLTQVRIDQAFKDAGLEFTDLSNGGFEMIVSGRLLTRSPQKTADHK
jgi:transcriptional regulator with XRE-family HTH domain